MEVLDLADGSGSAQVVENHLLTRLVDAAYSTRAGQPQPRYRAEQAHQALRSLAAVMNEQGTRDLAWWDICDWLSRTPRAIASGLTAGLCAGLMVGLWAGPVAGLAALGTVGSGVALLVRPRAGLAFGLIGGLFVGLVVGLQFGPKVGVLAGVLAVPIMFALSLFTAAYWWFLIEGMGDWPRVRRAPGGADKPADPWSSWRNAQVAGLTSALVLWLTVGLVSGLLVWWRVGPGSALVFGVMVGLLAGLVFGILSRPAWTAALTFLQLSLSDGLPPRLMRFLEDARHRGVLRTVGPLYQFRHARLQDLLGADAQPRD